MVKIRTRYAPSPTGYLHIGGARTALFCYLFARHYGGDFVIRMEDTDLKRNIKDAELAQINSLKWLGIIADESPFNPNDKYQPYRQSERLNIYKKYIDKLLKTGDAYVCYDNPSELEKQKEEQKKAGRFSFRYDRNWLKLSQTEKAKRHQKGLLNIRLSLPKNTVFKWTDLVRETIQFNSDDIGDFIIQKENGWPTYNLACVVDDHLMEMSHVWRGEEHISNTPKQLAIYKALKWKPPLFGHFTIITNLEGKKLSKRDTEINQFIDDYQKQGYLPEAIFNFLTLLGWSPSEIIEIMKPKNIIDNFEITGFSKAPSKFDLKKLQWFSQQYFQHLSVEQLNNQLRPYLKKELRDKADQWVNMLFLLFQPQLFCAKQIVKLTKMFFEDTPLNKEKLTFLQNDENKKVIAVFYEQIKNQPFTLDLVGEAIKVTSQVTNKKGKTLFLPLRLVTTHHDQGPELAKSIFLLGQKKVLQRLEGFL